MSISETNLTDRLVGIRTPLGSGPWRRGNVTSVFSLAARLRRTALAALVAAMALLAVDAATAGAAGQTFTTTYYTISVTNPADGQAPLYLANAPNGGVNLQRYFSGAPGEQWAPLDPVWPAVSPITGTSSVSDVIAGLVHCLGHLYCPFSVQVSAPRRFINRLTGNASRSCRTSARTSSRPR